MTLLAIKLYAKKAWLWLKHHWKFTLLVLWTCVIWVVARKNTNAYEKVLETTIKGYKEQMNILDDSYKKEIEDRRRAAEAYSEVIEHLEREYRYELEHMTFDKRAEIKNLIDSYYENPEELDRRLQDRFGFKYVE